MAVPKRKHSTGRKGRRRAAIRLDLPALVACPHCGQKKFSHVACPHCGQYKKAQVIKKKEPKKKKRSKS
jgi:large subunit ribosomal protein L32